MIDGPRLAPASGNPPRQLVVLLHGYGSNGADLIALAPAWRQVLPDAAFVAPDAPTRCPGAPGGYQWWPIQSFSMQERTAGAIGAAPVVDRFLDAELAAAGLEERDLLLVGFSQGTMLALHVAPRRPRALAGVIGFSGMLIAPERLAAEIVSRPPVLLVHGAADDVVPVAALAGARDVLADNGITVTTHVSPGIGHGVDPAGLAVATTFAREVLRTPR